MPASEFHCTVRGFKMLTPTVFELTFDTDKPMPFEAGQFVSVVVPGAGPKGRDLRRAYSIASSPEMNPVELCVKLVEEGPGTNFLYKMRPGDTFRGFAPYGDFTYEPKADRHCMFIATGTGVAPFRAMALSLAFKAAPPVSTTMLIGVRGEEELIYGELEKDGVKYVPIVSQPQGQWDGFKGRVTDYLRSLGADYHWKQTEYYLCGNGAMITEVKEILAAQGVEKDSIHQEKYY